MAKGFSARSVVVDKVEVVRRRGENLDSRTDSGWKLECVKEMEGTVAIVLLRPWRLTIGLEGDDGLDGPAWEGVASASQCDGRPSLLRMWPFFSMGPNLRRDPAAVAAGTGVKEPMVDCGSAKRDTVD